MARQNVVHEFRDMNFVVDDHYILTAKATSQASPGVGILEIDRKFQSQGRTTVVGAPGIEFSTVILHNLRTNIQPDTILIGFEDASCIAAVAVIANVKLNTSGANAGSDL